MSFVVTKTENTRLWSSHPLNYVIFRTSQKKRGMHRAARRKGDNLKPAGINKACRSIRTIANTLSFPQTKQLLIILSLVSGAVLFYFNFTETLPVASYFLLANNAAAIVIASLYQEDKEAFMRRISDQTILLATVLFLSFGLIAYLSN